MTEVTNTNVHKLTDAIIDVEAMVQELEAYIIKQDVYRTVLIPTTEGNRKVEMSGGDLLTRINQLKERKGQLSLAQQAQLQHVVADGRRTLYSLRTSFHELLRRELRSRHDQLAWNLDERRGREDEMPDTAEIDNRQRIAVIQQELNQSVT
ncbi:MAG: hypothetical protein R2867_47250 [Caldilineaceae bacterium]